MRWIIRVFQVLMIAWAAGFSAAVVITQSLYPGTINYLNTHNVAATPAQVLVMDFARWTLGPFSPWGSRHENQLVPGWVWLFLFWFVFLYQPWRNMKKRLAQRAVLGCIKCGYDLRGSGEGNLLVCPECGTENDREQLARRSVKGAKVSSVEDEPAI